MTTDVRKEFDRWLARQKNMDMDVQTALKNPMSPKITKFVALHAGRYNHTYIIESVPEHLHGEASFRIAMMHKAVLKQFEEHVSDMRNYALFAAAETRVTIQDMLRSYADQIDRMPEVGR